MRFDRDEVVARVDLGALADRLLGQRHPRSRTWACPNPSHSQTGRTPPVGIFTGRRGHQRWHCHGCGAGGTAIDLVLAAGPARDFREALEWLADTAGVSPSLERRPRRVTAPAAPHLRIVHPPGPTEAIRKVLGRHIAACWAHLHDPGGRDVLRWLTQSRALPIDLIDLVGVGADPGPDLLPRPPGIPRTRPAAVFPVRRGHDVVFVQSRPIAPKADQPRWLNTASSVAPNPRLAFYDPPGREREGPLLVTEGVLDALSAVSAGFGAAALLGSGAANEHTFAQIKEQRRPVILALDNDPSGQRAAAHLHAALKSRGVVVSSLVIPDGLNDLNDWHVACGHDWPDAFRSALRLTAATGRLGKRIEAPGVL